LYFKNKHISTLSGFIVHRPVTTRFAILNSLSLAIEPIGALMYRRARRATMGNRSLFPAHQVKGELSFLMFFSVRYCWTSDGAAVAAERLPLTVTSASRTSPIQAAQSSSWLLAEVLAASSTLSDDCCSRSSSTFACNNRSAASAFAWQRRTYYKSLN
jgi:hypothetical protein